MFCCCLFIDPTLYPTFPSLQEYFQNSRFWLAWLSSHNDGGVIVHVLPCFRLHMFQLRESPPPSTPCSCVLQARLTGASTGSIADICQHFLSFQKIKKHGQVQISIIYIYICVYVCICMHIYIYLHMLMISLHIYIYIWYVYVYVCKCFELPAVQWLRGHQQLATQQLIVPQAGDWTFEGDHMNPGHMTIMTYQVLQPPSSINLTDLISDVETGRKLNRDSKSD